MKLSLIKYSEKEKDDNTTGFCPTEWTCMKWEVLDVCLHLFYLQFKCGQLLSWIQDEFTIWRQYIEVHCFKWRHQTGNWKTIRHNILI